MNFQKFSGCLGTTVLNFGQSFHTFDSAPKHWYNTALFIPLPYIGTETFPTNIYEYCYY